MMSPDDRRRIELAREALKSRIDLSGAGQSIMASFALDERTARRLHAEEVARRRTETATKGVQNG